MVKVYARSKWGRRRKIDAAELIEHLLNSDRAKPSVYLSVAEAFQSRGLPMPRVDVAVISGLLRMHLLCRGPFCNRGAQFIAAPHGAPLIESTSCKSSHPWIPRRNIDLEKSGSESASAILYRTCSRSFKNDDAISETRPEIELARKHFRFRVKSRHSQCKKPCPLYPKSARPDYSAVALCCVCTTPCFIVLPQSSLGICPRPYPVMRSTSAQANSALMTHRL